MVLGCTGGAGQLNLAGSTQLALLDSDPSSSSALADAGTPEGIALQDTVLSVLPHEQNL